MADRWRILVVEDEEKLNRNIVSSLRKDGYIVNGATNGNDALHILWAEEYDVVICDLKMSGIDGFEVLRWSRAYRPNTRVILVGESGDAARTQALEAGAVSYLEKPLDLHLLKEELRRLLVQTGFSASLDSFDLLDVIQIISTSHKSIALLVSTGLEERGMLCFQGGSLVWAEYGMLRGEEAFFALAAHKNGTVVHQPWNEQVTPNVMQPLSRLILQAFQYRTKYAQVQQAFSGEQEGIAASAAVDDDSPFLVLTEHMEHMENTGQQDVTEQAPVPVFQEQGDSGGDMANEANGDTREWWEQTGKFAKGNTGSDNARAVPVTPFFGTLLNGSNGTQRTSSAGHKKQEPDGSNDKLTEHDDLPSWLTDQPTAAQLPVIRPSSLSESTQTPKVPSTPRLKPTPDEWQPPSRQQSQRFQRPIRAQRIVEQTQEATDSQETLAVDTRIRRTSPEWQSEEGTQQSPAGSFQGLTTSRKTSDALSFEEVQQNEQSSHNDRMGYPVTLTGGRLAVKQTSNSTALVSALQTLSYTISGFIAAAVVSLDGEPVAQVAVEDLNIARMCKNFSLLLKSVSQSLDEEAWGEHQDTVITSADRRFFMRPAGSEKRVFQLLITTHEADPIECGAVMTNVGEAITATLQY